MQISIQKVEPLFVVIREILVENTMKLSLHALQTGKCERKKKCDNTPNWLGCVETVLLILLEDNLIISDKNKHVISLQ